MPVPNPKKDENESQFVSRCIRFLKKERPVRPDKQIQAICLSQWRRKGESLHPDFERIQTLFIKRYGVVEGLDKFLGFISSNELDVSKRYHPVVQFIRESFRWVEPLISYYKRDKTAKYYKLIALTANISLNNHDYSDPEEMKQAAFSLSWRPVNLNHNHNAWLAFPRNRVEWAKVEDLAVEGILRIDNRERYVQDMIDTGKILHPSIEGRPMPGGGYHFVGLALLQKGVTLPGDPLTEIKPLFLHESIREALASESKDAEVEYLKRELHRKDRLIEKLSRDNRRIHKISKSMDRALKQNSIFQVDQKGRFLPWIENET